MNKITFCGHSNLSVRTSEILETKLRTEIEKLIKQGAREFLLGGYGDFDYLCSKIIREMKGVYPHIMSVLVIPYIDRDYNKDLYDCSEYPPIETVPKRFAILKRNEFMVNEADVVIAFVKYDWGGAVKTLEYARRKKKKIVLLSDE